MGPVRGHHARYSDHPTDSDNNKLKINNRLLPLGVLYSSFWIRTLNSTTTAEPETCVCNPGHKIFHRDDLPANFSFDKIGSTLFGNVKRFAFASIVICLFLEWNVSSFFYICEDCWSECCSILSVNSY